MVKESFIIFYSFNFIYSLLIDENYFQINGYSHIHHWLKRRHVIAKYFTLLGQLHKIWGK